MNKSLVLGFFDGVHKAHKAVINSAFKYSDDVTVVTFKDSPAFYFGKDIKYILSRKNSIEKIKALGVKEIIEQDFPKIASISAEDYLEQLVQKYHPISISTGFNHTFGKNKFGTAEFLEKCSKNFNYKYLCTEAVYDDNEIISSSLIKKYLGVGNIEKANFLLESNFILEGKVIHGAKLGRTIGFPTANINYPEKITQIPFGVYKTKVLINNEIKDGIMNWGMKPTVNNTVEPVVETHLLEFSDILYDKNIRIEVLNQIRAEKKFTNLEELKNQIKKDIEKCLEL